MKPSQTESASDPEGASPVPATGGRSRIIRWGMRVAAVLAVALLVVTGVRIFAVDIYTVNQNSMEPTLSDGDRIFVSKQYPGSAGVQRGDIIVFDGEGSFSPYQGQQNLFDRAAGHIGHWFGVGTPPQVFVKRVIGVGGDTVACCTAGQLTVNGETIDERSIPGEASELEFEVLVPAGRMWVMGDNRAESVDSRDLLGAPGGGMISEDRIIGRATSILWPPEDTLGIQEVSE